MRQFSRDCSQHQAGQYRNEVFDHKRWIGVYVKWLRICSGLGIDGVILTNPLTNTLVTRELLNHSLTSEMLETHQLTRGNMSPSQRIPTKCSAHCHSLLIEFAIILTLSEESHGHRSVARLVRARLHCLQSFELLALGKHRGQATPLAACR